MTMFRLGKRSLSRLEGVHPDLVRVVQSAIKATVCDFTVLEGVRSEERQRKLFQAGASKIMNSRHLTGHAVDLGAYIDGEVRWDWPLYYQIAAAMMMASVEEGVPIRWGGDWDSDGEYDDEKWRDGPHFELPRKVYPE
jgi:peptidoglycan L-alanyl-D-glutamate endopeptidase CwlK